MLGESLKSAQELATSLSKSSISGDVGQRCVSSGKAFGNEVVPVIVNLQKKVVKTAGEIRASVEKSLSAINKSEDVKTVLLTLGIDAIGEKTRELEQLADSVESKVGEFVDVLNDSVGDLHIEAQNYAAKAKKYSSQAQHYRAEAKKIQTRIDIVNNLTGSPSTPWGYLNPIGPLIKAGDELVSLIESGKTVEARISSAVRNLSANQTQAHQAMIAEQEANSLHGQVARLSIAIGNLKNAITITEKKAMNEKEMIADITKPTAELFLNALKSSFTQLIAIAD